MIDAIIHVMSFMVNISLHSLYHVNCHVGEQNMELHSSLVKLSIVKRLMHGLLTYTNDAGLSLTVRGSCTPVSATPSQRRHGIAAVLAGWLLAWLKLHIMLRVLYNQQFHRVSCKAQLPTCKCSSFKACHAPIQLCVALFFASISLVCSRQPPLAPNT